MNARGHHQYSEWGNSFTSTSVDLLVGTPDCALLLTTTVLESIRLRVLAQILP